MATYEDHMSRAHHAEKDAADWDKWAQQAEAKANYYRECAKQRRADAFDYRQLAERAAEEINKALEGIAA